MAKNFKDLQKKVDNMVADHEKEIGRLELKLGDAKSNIEELTKALSRAEEEEDAKKFSELSSKIDVYENMETICKNKIAKAEQELKAADSKEIVKACRDRRAEIIEEYEAKMKPLAKQLMDLMADLEETMKAGDNVLITWNGSISAIQKPDCISSEAYQRGSCVALAFDMFEEMERLNIKL